VKSFEKRPSRKLRFDSVIRVSKRKPERFMSRCVIRRWKAAVFGRNRGIRKLGEETVRQAPGEKRPLPSATGPCCGGAVKELKAKENALGKREKRAVAEGEGTGRKGSGGSTEGEELPSGGRDGP